MQKRHPNSELLQLQTTTENQNGNKEQSNTELKEVNRIENTPFTIITIPEKESFVAVGNWRLTDWETKEKCMKMIEEKSWDIIFALIQATITIMDKNPEYKETEKQKF